VLELLDHGAELGELGVAPGHRALEVGHPRPQLLALGGGAGGFRPLGGTRLAEADDLGAAARERP
jgi:hypothetical protein